MNTTERVDASAPPRALFLVGIGLLDDLVSVDRLALDGVTDPLAPSTSTRIIPHAPLAALAVEVTLEDFVGVHADSNLADVNWLAPRALAHEALINAARSSDTGSPRAFLPAPFATLFSGAESLARALAHHAETLLPALRATAHHDEYRLRLSASRADIIARLGAAQADAATARRSGISYLKQKRLIHQPPPEVDQWLDRLGTGALAKLASVASDSCPARVTGLGQSGDIVWGRALLVPRSRRPELDAIIESIRHDEPSVHIELKGPWAPYAFVPPFAPDNAGTASPASTGARA
jgi:hypothetical protein